MEFTVAQTPSELVSERYPLLLNEDDESLRSSIKRIQEQFGGGDHLGGAVPAVGAVNQDGGALGEEGHFYLIGRFNNHCEKRKPLATAVFVQRVFYRGVPCVPVKSVDFLLSHTCYERQLSEKFMKLLETTPDGVNVRNSTKVEFAAVQKR
eukprot:566891_1